MKKKSSVLYKISVILLITAVVCLITAMIFQAVFDSNGASAVVEVVCAGVAGFLAFIGIILACLRNNKKKGDSQNYEKSEERE